MAEVASEKPSSGDEIVTVYPKPNKGLTSKLVDLFEKLVVKLGYDSSQIHHYLSGNFAPVPDETPPTVNLPVSGYLPVSHFFHFQTEISKISDFYFCFDFCIFKFFSSFFFVWSFCDMNFWIIDTTVKCDLYFGVFFVRWNCNF